jgi:hypothetical protein
MPIPHEKIIGNPIMVYYINANIPNIFKERKI